MFDSVVSTTCVKHAESFARQQNIKYNEILGNCLSIGAFSQDLFFAEQNKIKNILFVGSDVISLEECWLPFLHECNVYAVWHQLINELNILGFNAKLFPLLPDIEPMMKRNPENIISCYLPVEIPFKYQLFQVDKIKEIAKRLPEYIFLGIGHSIDGPSNFYNLGYLNNEELRKVWSKTKYNLRITLHEGAPQDVIRCGQHGIPSIVEYLDMPETIRAFGVDDVISKIRTDIKIDSGFFRDALYRLTDDIYEKI